MTLKTETHLTTNTLKAAGGSFNDEGKLTSINISGALGGQLTRDETGHRKSKYHVVDLKGQQCVLSTQSRDVEAKLNDIAAALRKDSVTAASKATAVPTLMAKPMILPKSTFTCR